MKTSVSVVENDDPASVRRRHEQEYMKYSMESKKASAAEPKFKLYLYGDSGEMVQELLSLHDIQQMLLAKSKKVGGISKLNKLSGRDGNRKGNRPKRRKKPTPGYASTRRSDAPDDTESNTPKPEIPDSLQAVIDRVSNIMSTAAVRNWTKGKPGDDGGKIRNKGSVSSHSSPLGVPGTILTKNGVYKGNKKHKLKPKSSCVIQGSSNMFIYD